MKNKFALLAILGMFLIAPYNMHSQDADTMQYVTEEVEETTTQETEETAVENVTTEPENQGDASFHQIIKQKFIEGGRIYGYCSFMFNLRTSFGN